jgi:hypothetical protein
MKVLPFFARRIQFALELGARGGGDLHVSPMPPDLPLSMFDLRRQSLNFGDDGSAVCHRR